MLFVKLEFNCMRENGAKYADLSCVRWPMITYSILHTVYTSFICDSVSVCAWVSCVGLCVYLNDTFLYIDASSKSSVYYIFASLAMSYR